MRYVVLAIAALVVVGAIGGSLYMKGRSQTTVLGKKMSKEEAKASEKEMTDALLKVDPNDPETFKNLTNLKTEGGKKLSQMMTEILDLRKQTGFDKYTAELIDKLDLAPLSDPKKCKELHELSLKLKNGSHQYTEGINQLFNKWVAQPDVEPEFLQSKGKILRVSRSVEEWATRCEALTAFCLKHRPQFDLTDGTLVFKDALVKEANQLLTACDEANEKMVAASNAATEGLTKFKESVKDR